MIDILITGSSRPHLYPYFWKSFNEMMHYRGEKNIIVHEDFVFPKESEKVVNWINKNIPEAQLITHKPAIGLGLALDDIIKNKLKNKYCFYTQEDWEYERPVDIDQILWVMDRNPKINLVFFNKIKNEKSLDKAKQPEYDYDGLKMCLYHSWTFLPGIWRTSHVKKYWRCRKERPEGYFTNAFGSHNRRMSIKYCEENIGAYMYGKTEDYRYVRHLGNDWRMAKWRLDNGRHGGAHDKERMDLPYMAPWIKYEERPVQRKHSKEEIDKMLSEEAGMK